MPLLLWPAAPCLFTANVGVAAIYGGSHMHRASPARSHRVILPLVLLAQFVPPLVLFSIGALAPLLRDSLALNREQIGSLSALFSTSAALVAVPSGWWADRVGVRRLLSGGQVVGGLALTATAVLPTYRALCLVLCLVGIAFGTVAVVTAKAIVEWVPRERRATAMGAKQLAVSCAGGVASAVIPTLALWSGWRQAFTLMGCLMLASALGDLLLYRDRPQEVLHAKPLRGQGRGHALWRNPNVWGLAAMGMCFGGAQYSFTTYLPLFLLERGSMPLVLAANFLAQAQVGAMASRVPVGWISDRWCPRDRQSLLRAMGVIALGALLGLLLVPAGTPMLWLSAFVILYGASGLSWGGAYFTLAAELVDQEAVGVVAGLMSTSMHVGNLVTAPLFGYVADATGSYTLSWGLLGLWLLLGIGMLSLVRTTPSGLEAPRGATREGRVPVALRSRANRVQTVWGQRTWAASRQDESRQDLGGEGGEHEC